VQLLNVFWRLSSFRHLLLSFVGRLSTVFRGLQSSTSLYFAVLSYEKYVVVRLDTINPLLGPTATTIIQIQVGLIAMQKFLYAVFTRQIMV